LLNNSLFGKTIENVFKRIDMHLVTHWENIGKKVGARALIAKPNFKNSVVFTENLVAIHMGKVKVLYNKPIYIGFSVLEISKTLMYDFLFNFLKPTYNSNLTVCYMDTDSFILEVQTDDFYSDMKPYLEQHFDTSKLSSANQFGYPVINEGTLGLFKDECGEKLLWEFVGLRAKVYEINVEGELTKKCKGVTKVALADVVSDDCSTKEQQERRRREEYKDALFHNKIILKRMTTFRSIKHTIQTQTINKVAIDAQDDKRFLLPNSHNTLAWGHYQIPNNV